MAASVFGLSVAWTVVNLGLTMPVLEHLTGQRQDFGQFDGLQGNLGMLLGLIGIVVTGLDGVFWGALCCTSEPCGRRSWPTA